MGAEHPTPEHLRETFQRLLNSALTRGCITPNCAGLGPDTLAAIDVVAYAHPDAEADCITAAYDAFRREHG